MCSSPTNPPNPPNHLHRPDGKCELIKVYEKGEVPKLNQVSKLIREESQVR